MIMLFNGFHIIAYFQQNMTKIIIYI